jgi:hypothetical protein
MRSLVTRFAALAGTATIGASLALVAAGTATAAVQSAPSGWDDGVVPGLTQGGDPVAALTGNAIRPLSNSIGTNLGGLPVSTSSVTNLLRDGFDDMS